MPLALRLVPHTPQSRPLIAVQVAQAVQQNVERGSDQVVAQDHIGVVQLDLTEEVIQHHALVLERLDLGRRLLRLLLEARWERWAERAHRRERRRRTLLRRRRMFQGHVAPYTRTHSDNLALVLFEIDDRAKRQTHDRERRRVFGGMRICVRERRDALGLVHTQLHLGPRLRRALSDIGALQPQPAGAHNPALDDKQLKSRGVRAKRAAERRAADVGRQRRLVKAVLDLEVRAFSRHIRELKRVFSRDPLADPRLDPVALAHRLKLLHHLVFARHPVRLVAIHHNTWPRLQKEAALHAVDRDARTHKAPRRLVKHLAQQEKRAMQIVVVIEPVKVHAAIFLKAWHLLRSRMVRRRDGCGLGRQTVVDAAPRLKMRGCLGRVHRLGCARRSLQRILPPSCHHAKVVIFVHRRRVALALLRRLVRPRVV